MRLRVDDRVLEARSSAAEGEHRHLRPLLRDALSSSRSDAFDGVCDEAIRCGLLPEHLIILLKREWHDTKGMRGLMAEDAAQVLAERVTTCIKAYFRPRPSRHS